MLLMDVNACAMVSGKEEGFTLQVITDIDVLMQVKYDHIDEVRLLLISTQDRF